MSKDDHFIYIIKDEKNITLEFERFRLKTANGSYKSLLKFINHYGLENYVRCFNKGGQPAKVVSQYLQYDPYKETLIFEKSYSEFLDDLKRA